MGLFAIAVSAAAVMPWSAQAETRVLVVGASGYPNLPDSMKLQAPKNDSRELANTLVGLGVPAAHITILADGVTGLTDGLASSGPANRDAILSELDRLAETSAKGDLVVFYFSGHGTQQPDLNGDEGGSPDEVFLPYDVGKYEDGSIKNALVDDDLDERIRKILAKGVDFFGIIDACHSGTGFRAFDEDESRAKQVDPAELGVPAFAEAENRAAFAAVDAAPGEGAGRAAFFYAAQEVEVAREVKPKNSETGEFFSVFTYNIIKRINQTPNLTYRTLHQAVVDDIKRGNLGASQTPQLEGELLDEPFLRLSGVGERRQWPVVLSKLQAGELAGVTTGTILALYNDPADPDEEAVAHAVVTAAGATKSLVEQVAYPCTEFDADGNCMTPVDATVFKKGRFGRVVEPGVDFSLVLSEPVRVDPNDGYDYALATAALRDAVGSDALSKRVSLRSSGYDLAVGLVDGKLAFAPSAGLIDARGPNSSPRLTLPDNPDAAAATVASAITRMAKVLALQRIGGAKEGEAVGLQPTLMIERAKVGTIVDGECSQDRSGSYDAAVPAGDAPVYAPCDILSVAMANTGKRALDVTVLLVESNFAMSLAWPLDGSANRIYAGEKIIADLLQMGPEGQSNSEERLVFLTVPGVARTTTIFDNLEQEGLRAGPTDEDPAVAAARQALDVGLNEMSRSTTTGTASVEEEMSVDVRPFFMGQGSGR
ncbi:MAG: caspase family protein [Rhizobiaceae bacterium]|nr:caspase family protein [Rhizobiaceae bacterium]